MPEQPQPRRRASDRDRRRWNDDRLNDLKGDVEDTQSEQRALAALYRQLAPLPDLLAQYMKTTDARLDRMHTAIENLRNENRVAHKRVAHGRDPENGELLPPQPAKLSWGDVVKVATAVSLVLGPIAVIVAALLAGGSA